MLNASSVSIRSPHSRRTRIGGVTIAEVMIASCVMAFAITTSITVMQSGFATLDTARGNTLASQILQSEIERIRLMSWANVTDPDKMMGEHKVDLKAVFATNNELARKFTLVRTVKDDSTRPGEGVDIYLQVVWQTYDGRSHTRSFQTKYVKNGLYDYYYSLAGP
jgi:Tfp pilus assembly protein PilV